MTQSFSLINILDIRVFGRILILYGTTANGTIAAGRAPEIHEDFQEVV